MLRYASHSEAESIDVNIRVPLGFLKPPPLERAMILRQVTWTHGNRGCCQPFSWGCFQTPPPEEARSASQGGGTCPEGQQSAIELSETVSVAEQEPLCLQE